MQKNLKEYFCDDIFEFGYLINQKEKISEYLEKVENFDKFAQKRAKIWSITWVLVMGYPQKEPFAPLKKY